MKLRHLVGFLLPVFVTIFVAGCKDYDPEPLRFYGDSYEVPVHGVRYIGVKSGSGDYTIQVENTGIFSASEDEGWSNPAGMLLVRGLLTGESILYITDNNTGETTTLKIKVVDHYEVLRVSTLESNHPVLSKTPFIFLISNESRDLYLADKEPEGETTGNDLRIRGKGNYAFSLEDNKPCLTLTYATDDKGKLTNNPTYSPEAHKFQITRGSEFMLHYLDENLNLGWGTIAKNFSEDQCSLVMKMEQAESGYKFETVPEQVEIPAGILN
ncbi:MAG: hypothetical protein AB2L20_15540 [Mangrovibacterium sp.]